MPVSPGSVRISISLAIPQLTIRKLALRVPPIRFPRPTCVLRVMGVGTRDWNDCGLSVSDYEDIKASNRWGGCMHWTREQTYQTSRKRKGNADSMTCKQFAAMCSLCLITTIGCATCTITNDCCPSQQHCCHQTEVCTPQPAPCYQAAQACQAGNTAATIPNPTSYHSSESMIPAPSIASEAAIPMQGNLLPASQLPVNILPGADGFTP